MNDAMKVPPAERYFEDYHVGMVDEFGEVAVTSSNSPGATIHSRCTSMRATG